MELLNTGAARISDRHWPRAQSLRIAQVEVGGDGAGRAALLREDDGPVAIQEHPVLEVPTESAGEDRALDVPADA